MKKKIGYVLLILISILGSRLIFGKDYHLNSNNLIDNNLYLYDIFNKNDVNLTMIDDENLFYILSSGNSKKMQYVVVKYNLISNKIINEYQFDTNYVLEEIKMFKVDKHIYLTAINNNVVYEFNNNLDLIDQKSVSDMYDSYAIMNNSFVTSLGNQILKNESLYSTLPKSCGNNTQIVYAKDMYLHFHNADTGFGCLYNVKSKKIDYLDYEKADIINDRLLEYQDNRINFKYDNNIYYFYDITEASNLKMHVNGDYLFTINLTNNLLRIYNLETRKVIYERTLIELHDSKIEDVLIDDYAYFTISKDNVTRLYIWDYLKEKRINKDMISYNEKEYKFKNNELKEEIKNSYGIDIDIYDGAVSYFSNAYVIPSYDDILINSRLMMLRDILKDMANKGEFVRNTRICLEKSITDVNSSVEIDFVETIKDNSTIIAIDITRDSFKNILIEELSNLAIT